jgi:hypothetical protein
MAVETLTIESDRVATHLASKNIERFLAFLTDEHIYQQPWRSTQSNNYLPRGS